MSTAVKVPVRLENLVRKINDYQGSDRADWATDDYVITDCPEAQLRHMMNKLIWIKEIVNKNDYDTLFTLINKAIKRVRVTI